MKISNVIDYTRGWFIGNFEPAVLKTADFEVGILTHKRGEEWPNHYHKEATEYNVLLKGAMTINDKQIYENEIFVIEKGEPAKPKFLTDCTVLVIKVPWVPGDKYVISN